jgi:hypothetical protein
MKYERQQSLKEEGRQRRNAKRQEVKTFVSEFRGANHRAPSPEEIAVHFGKSLSWVRDLDSREAQDARP